jgi:hypothetical protein
LQRLKEQDLWVLAIGPRRIRAVANYHVTAADIEAALVACRAILA